MPFVRNYGERITLKGNGFGYNEEIGIFASDHNANRSDSETTVGFRASSELW